MTYEAYETYETYENRETDVDTNTYRDSRDSSDTSADGGADRYRHEHGDGDGGSAPIRIVLADDERMVRTALRVILDAEPDLTVVGEAATGAEAVSVVRAERPDVVLMDVRMPEIDGIQATRLILADPAPPRVVVVTTFENDAYVYDALRVGAAGFLLKRAAPEELVGAVRLVARSDSLLYPAAVRGLAAEHARRNPAAPPPWAARLTDREAEVLRRMAKGLTNAEIATELGVGPATVKTHVAAVLAKTGARDRTQAVIAAYETSFIVPA